MSEEKNQNKELKEDTATNKGTGPDGVDKAPGEETSQNNIQFVQETQKVRK